MKTKYFISMVVLIIIAVSFEYLVFYSPLGESTRIERAIQSAGIFVALLAAIIALSTADPKIKKVNIKIEQSIDKTNIGKYPKNKLSDNLKTVYSDFSDPIKSHRVQFKMTNISGFALEKPTLTFKLPLQKQHPQNKGQIFSERSFNSNLFNSQDELRLLEFADTRILSNSNLPYWNDKDSITIWIRMVIEDPELKPFVVDVSVNCKNANGVTNKIKINPKKLIT